MEVYLLYLSSVADAEKFRRCLAQLSHYFEGIFVKLKEDLCRAILNIQFKFEANRLISSKMVAIKNF